MVKNTLCVLAVAMASNSVLAADSHWYVGVDVLNTKAEQTNTFQANGLFEMPAHVITPYPVSTMSSANGSVSNLSTETGFGIHVGTQFLLASQFALAVEAEYLSFGSFSGNDVATINGYVLATGQPFSVELKGDIGMDVTATNLNIKPKYYFGGNNFYLGAIAGVGIYKVDLDLKELGNDKGSDWGFNYGVEAGYELTPELTFSAGYRMFTTSIDVKDIDQDFELELDSFYAGLDYKF